VDLLGRPRSGRHIFNVPEMPRGKTGGVMIEVIQFVVLLVGGIAAVVYGWRWMRSE